MAYEFFYQDTPSSLEPNYGNFIGYRVPAGQLGASTSVQTANQLKEVTNLLNQGIKKIEVSALQPETFEMIPDQHLKELNKLTKITGSNPSMHGFVNDPSGFTQQGWNEENREIIERQMKSLVERGHQLNPKGEMPITIHASQIPGTEKVPWKNPETGKIEEVDQRMIAVNRETGEFAPLMREEIYQPGSIQKQGDKYTGELYKPEERLKSLNVTHWDKQLSQLTFYKERADELLSKNLPLVQHFLADLKEGKINPKTISHFPEQQRAVGAIQNAEIYLKNASLSLNNLFEQAFKTASPKIKDKLYKASQNYSEQLNKKGHNPMAQANAMQELIDKMFVLTTNKKTTPQLYIPVEEFAKQKASQTIGNAAFHGYKKNGNTSPVLSIENPPYGMAISTAEDLKDLVEMSRQRFIEKATKQGMSEEKAKKTAEKLIGATWDTSHISMIRKQGFGKDKLVQQAEVIAPYIKHIHLNDNLGTTHTDLPPGMGDVPMKEVLEKLESKNKNTAKIFEGTNFFQHFQTSPHPYVLEALGSPMYSAMMQPYWNQTTGFQQNYFGGYGTILPDQHFSMYGGGFSQLPVELGGQVQGRASRFSGTPNA